MALFEKLCSKCKTSYLATTEFFYRRKEGKLGLQSHCKKCVNQYNAKYQRLHRDKLNQQNRERYVTNYAGKYVEGQRATDLKRKHGPEALKRWNDFFVDQGGICPGCLKHQSELKQKLSLDHDHETGEYRGLLCRSCNLRAGSSEKDIQILENIVKYLKAFYGKEMIK